MRCKLIQNNLIWVFFAAVFWSFQGVLGKLNTWNPISMTAIRAVFATLAIGGFRQDLRPSKEKINWVAAIFVAITGLLFMCANRYTTAANAVVLQYIMPVFVIVMSWLLWRQVPKKVDVVCSVLMLSGVVLCFLGGLDTGNLLGNIFAVLSAASYAGVYLASRMKNCDVQSYAYQGCLLSCLLLCYIPFDRNFTFSWTSLLSVGAMGLCVGVGYVCFAKGLFQNTNPTKASLIAYIEPVLNPLWVSLFAHEQMTLTAVIGMAVVLVTAIVYGILSNHASAKPEDAVNLIDSSKL